MLVQTGAKKQPIPAFSSPDPQAGMGPTLKFAFEQPIFILNISRQLRVQYEGAVYHVTARGNSGQRIYTGDQDRNQFLDFLVRRLEQQRWLCHAYRLMGTSGC